MIYIFQPFQSTITMGWPPPARWALRLWPKRISEPLMVRVACIILWESLSIFLSPGEVTFKGLHSLFSNSLCAFHGNFYYLYYLTLVLQGNCISISPLDSKFIENRLYLLIFTSQMPRTVAGMEETFSTCLMNDWNDLSKITMKKQSWIQDLNPDFMTTNPLLCFHRLWLKQDDWISCLKSETIITSSVR